jgi:hypothetical protein
MATNYPASLDVFTNPTSGNTLDTPSHSLQHADINDAVEAIEAKLGVGASAATSATSGQVLMKGATNTTWTSPAYEGDWTAFTPVFTNFTLGNGTTSCTYKQYGQLVVVRINIVLGTTSVMGTTPLINHPVTGRTTFAGSTNIGNIELQDTSATTNYKGYFLYNTTTAVAMFVENAAATYVTRTGINSTIPFTWASTDVISGLYIYEAAL